MRTLRELGALCLTLCLSTTASAEAPPAPDSCFAEHPITVILPFFQDRGADEGVDPELVGAQLFTPAERGLTAEWLHRELQQRVNARRSDSRCPLDVRGIQLSIQSGGPGFWINISSQNPAAARQVLERARLHAPEREK